MVGSAIGGILPIAFSLVQIVLPIKKGGLDWNLNQEKGEYSIFILVGSVISWLITSGFHLILSFRMVKQTAVNDKTNCTCDIVQPQNPLASNADKEAYEALNVAICYAKCPPAQPFCPLKKTKEESYDEYLAKCNELAAKGKAAFDALPKEAAAAVDASEDEDELL